MTLMQRRIALMGAIGKNEQNGFIVGGTESMVAVSRNEIELRSIRRWESLTQRFIFPINIHAGDIVRMQLTQQSGGILSGRYTCGLNGVNIAADKIVSNLAELSGSVTATSDVTANGFVITKNSSSGAQSWTPPIVFTFSLYVNDVQVI